ncbi:hypothetical protein ACOSQ2_023433 [Xanthoceras sorbifolium]
MWFVISGNRIHFSTNEFCLVSGLRFENMVASTKNTKTNEVSRIRRKYFNGAKKVTGLILQGFFEDEIQEENDDDDDDIIKIPLLLILEMTLLGKNLRTSVEYWAMKLVDNLDEFN